MAIENTEHNSSTDGTKITKSTVKHRSLSVFCILAALVSALTLAGSQKAWAYGQTQSQAKRPIAPATAFGKLVRVERRNTASMRVVHTKGVRIESQKAEAGKVFVILHFVGKSSVDSEVLDEDRALRHFLPHIGGAAATRTNARSWLTDGKDQKYSNPYLVMGGLKRQVAFQVPADVTDLIWHDGKQAFQLEPYPVAIQESKPDGSK